MVSANERTLFERGVGSSGGAPPFPFVGQTLEVFEDQLQQQFAYAFVIKVQREALIPDSAVG
ncbi:hypothetical protein D3C76_1356380 [compost metagenome]